MCTAKPSGVSIKFSKNVSKMPIMIIAEIPSDKKKTGATD